MIGAPECRPAESIHTESTIPTLQEYDIWSFGCIMSEAATWMIRGLEGLSEYRRSRKAELERLGRADSDSFHDGLKVLDSVQEQLRNLRELVPQDDTLTRNVLDAVDSMLRTSQERPSAKDIKIQLESAYYRWRRDWSSTLGQTYGYPFPISPERWIASALPVRHHLNRGWVVQVLSSRNVSLEDLQLGLNELFGPQDFAIKVGCFQLQVQNDLLLIFGNSTD